MWAALAGVATKAAGNPAVQKALTGMAGVGGSRMAAFSGGLTSGSKLSYQTSSSSVIGGAAHTSPVMGIKGGIGGGRYSEGGYNYATPAVSVGHWDFSGSSDGTPPGKMSEDHLAGINNNLKNWGKSSTPAPSTPQLWTPGTP